MLRIMRASAAVAVLAGVGLFGVGLLWAGTPAFAHNSFTGSTPKNGAVLDTAPKEVSLKFLAKLDPKTTKVTVTDPAGASVMAGAATFAGSTVVAPLRPTSAGVYVVGYEVASGDGHPIRGKVSFTLTPKAVPIPTLPPPPSPSPTAEPPPTTAPSIVALPAADTSPEGGTTWWPWLVGGIVVAGSLGAFGMARRRRTP